MPLKDPEANRKYWQRYRKSHRVQVSIYSILSKERHREQLKEVARRYYKKNRARIIIRNKAYLAKHRKHILNERQLWLRINRAEINHKRMRRYYRITDFLNKFKLRQGCIDCGFKGHPLALQFDHVRGKKLGNPSQMKDRSIKAIMRELNKCVVRCANCHFVRHARYKGVRI